jgi:hypothetical protein
MQDSQTTAITAIRVHLAVRNRKQPWLAESIGKSPFWLSRRMSGANMFNLEDLDRIAAVFGVTLDQLLAAADAVPMPEATVAS